VPLVDSAGLEALVDIQQAMQASGGTVKLAAPTQLCEDIFRVSGLAQRFEVYTDAKAAVRSYVR
jgi:anti-anti-sigma factor